MKWSFEINKGAFRVCHLWWVLTCKIPQTATAWVWDAVGLHAQILTHPEEISDYTLHSEQRIFWAPFSPFPAAAIWTSFLLATAGYITFTTFITIYCTITLNIWSNKRTHVSEWGIREGSSPVSFQAKILKIRTWTRIWKICNQRILNGEFPNRPLCWLDESHGQMYCHRIRQERRSSPKKTAHTSYCIIQCAAWTGHFIPMRKRFIFLLLFSCSLPCILSQDSLTPWV